MTLSLLISFQLFVAPITTDTVILVKDARLETVVARQAQLNKRASMQTSSGMYKGYRLQVASTPNREEAFQLKTLLLNKFPDQKSYLIFQSPYFKVRIGNFFKRSEADAFRKQLQKAIPKTAYIVDDTIDYIPTDEELQNQ